MSEVVPEKDYVPMSDAHLLKLREISEKDVMDENDAIMVLALLPRVLREVNRMRFLYYVVRERRDELQAELTRMSADSLDHQAARDEWHTQADTLAALLTEALPWLEPFRLDPLARPVVLKVRAALAAPQTNAPEA